MDKQYALNQLQHTANVFVLGLASTTLLASPEVRPVLEKGKATFGTYEITFDQVVALLRHDRAGPVAIMEFLKMHLRSLVSDMYRLIESYAKDSKQAHVMRAAPWHTFSRILRNALAHDGKFVFTPNDIGLLPVTWSGCTIDATMQGNDLTLEFFSPADGWRLCCEMQQYAEQSFI